MGSGHTAFVFYEAAPKHSGVSFLVRFVLFGSVLLRHRRTLCRKGRKIMKNNKNLKFCLDLLRFLQNNESEPGQRSALESASKRLKQLQQRTRRDQEEVYLVVREIAEVLLKTLDDQALIQ